MRSFFVVAVIALSVACGKSKAEQQAEATAKAAEELAKAAEAATKQGTAAAANDMAKAMEGMAAAFAGGKGADGKPVQTVAFQTLQTHLPTVAGWEMAEPHGERMTMPMPFSQVETDYRKGDSEIEVTIVDTGFAQLLIAPWSMMLATGYSTESSDGYEKATTVGGHPAFEKWNARNKDGELNILVGKRFMVSLDGRELSDIKDLHAFASAIDLNAIAGLK